MNRTPRSRGVALAAVVLAFGLAASVCGSDDDGGTADAATETVADTAAAADDSTAPSAETITENSAAPVAVATAAFDTTPEQESRIRVDKVDSIAETLPEAWQESGKLKVGIGSFDAPPLILYADDETTLIGNEIDIAYLVADTLGLEIEVEPTSWENLFLSVESGQYDVGFANITVTEERKEKYDFASYRVDSLAFEATAGSDIVVNEPADVAGLKVAVGSGTNQEQILLAWDAENQAAGLEPAEITYYQNESRLPAGARVGPDRPLLRTGTVGLVPPRDDRQDPDRRRGSRWRRHPAQIAAMSLKDSGLAEPIAAALNHVIESGAYGEVLAKWGLEVEAIDVSEVNPPGLPAS